MNTKKTKNQARTQAGQEMPNWTEEQARDYFEARRWGGKPACVHCGSINVYRVGGESHRAGLLECRDCRKQFTVTTKTIMEDTHLKLTVWARAFHLMCSSKKGISALQLQRNLGLGSYRTAWFLAHRIREAMRFEPVAGMLKAQVQVDETYVGGKPRRGEQKNQWSKKVPVLALVETNGNVVSGRIDTVDSDTLRQAMKDVCDPATQIVTDGLNAYRKPAAEFGGGHEVVNHQDGEYVNERGAHTNTVESYFALLKRGVHGTFHHVSRKHLDRYCNEFSFRWNGRELTDVERRDEAVEGMEGKRLVYRTPIGNHFTYLKRKGK